MPRPVAPPSSPYGDHDFVPEGPPVSLSELPYQNTGFSVNHNPPPNDTPRAPSHVPYNMPQNSLNEPPRMIPSLTQEDILFLRNFRSDTLVSKTLPIFIVGAGALYLYRRYRNLPNRFWHYLGVAGLAQVLGPIMNRQELVKRLERDMSETPWKEAIRKQLNITKLPMDQRFNSGRAQFNVTPDSELSDWSSPEPRFTQPDQRPPSYGNSNLPSLGSLGGQDLGPGRQDSGTTRPISYEELRARNRGYIK